LIGLRRNPMAALRGARTPDAASLCFACRILCVMPSNLSTTATQPMTNLFSDP